MTMLLFYSLAVHGSSVAIMSLSYKRRKVNYGTRCGEKLLIHCLLILFPYLLLSQSQYHTHTKKHTNTSSRSPFSFAIYILLHTGPIPPDVLPVWGSRGTQTTCSIQGFFAQTSIATVLYSGCLSIYYYLVIRCGWSQRRLENSKIEWMMHIFPLCFAIGTSSTSVAMGLMNPIGWDCWIASVPIECEESWLNGGRTNCERGDNANLFQWLFFYIPLWITIFGVTTIMVSIILKFWVQERHNEAWRRKSVGTPSSSIVRFRRGGSALAAAGGRGSSIARRRTHLEEVVWQSLFYVGGFYFAWIFPTILRVHEVTADVVYYHWVQLSATFIPTQGICNLIVYLRPQYLDESRTNDGDENNNFFETMSCSQINLKRVVSTSTM